MISPNERKKIGFPLLTSSTAEMKKYMEVYGLYVDSGFTKELCEAYADAFTNNVKKPSPFDIIQLASLYDRIYDHKTAFFYLEMLGDKKLGSDERFIFDTQMLKTLGKIGNWRDGVDFRTSCVSFLQRYSEKATLEKQAELYMSLALTDCAAKNYQQALKLLKFGYKPHGKKDTTLLEIFITAVYIFAKADDRDGLEGALQNVEGCLKLFGELEFSWQNEYYRQRIENASKGTL